MGDAGRGGVDNLLNAVRRHASITFCADHVGEVVAVAPQAPPLGGIVEDRVAIGGGEHGIAFARLALIWMTLMRSRARSGRD